MKGILLSLFVFAAISALAADPPNPKPETPPVITAEDREPLHEAHERLMDAQNKIASGQAAQLMIPDLQKAQNAAYAVLAAKCGAYGVTGNDMGRLDCGKTKQAASPEPPKKEEPTKK